MMLSKVVFSSLVIVLLPAVCSAQDATGRIVGVVYDQQGRVIPDVQITVTNAATQINRRTVSDQEGYFQVLELSIGSYQVTSEHDGFRKTITAAEKLLINQTLRIDITMQVGLVFQTVIVDARPAPVETVNATLGQSVTSRPLVNLPLDGREVLNLAALQPGVTEGNDDNGGAGNFSIAGGRTDSVTYLLDGGLNNDLVNNAIVYDPNPDAIAEFRLLTSNYTAEYGRNGSGVISVVTKSGADQLHGSLFEFLRNEVLNANTFFNNRDGLPRDILKRNQFGGTLGGPIFIPQVIDGRRRFFFFVDYQGQRQVQTIAVNDTATFTAHELAGDFSLSDNGRPDAGVVCFLTGFDPGGVPCTDASGNTPGVAHTFFQPDPNKAKAGIIDPSRINGVAKAYIAAGLIPTSPTGLLSSQESAKDDRNEITTKLDCSVGPKDKLAVTVGILRNSVFSPFVSSGVPGFPARFDFGTDFLNLAYRRIFSPSLLNEFHVGRRSARSSR